MRRLRFADDDTAWNDDMLHGFFITFSESTVHLGLICSAPEHEDSLCRWYADDPETGFPMEMHEECWFKQYVDDSGDSLMDFYAGPELDLQRFKGYRMVWAPTEWGPIWRLLVVGDEFEVVNTSP